MTSFTDADLRQNAVILTMRQEIADLRKWRDAYRHRMAMDKVLDRLVALENFAKQVGYVPPE